MNEAETRAEHIDPALKRLGLLNYRTVGAILTRHVCVGRPTSGSPISLRLLQRAQRTRLAVRRSRLLVRPRAEGAGQVAAVPADPPSNRTSRER